MNVVDNINFDLVRMYTGGGITIGFLKLNGSYLCETIEKTPLTLPSGEYGLEKTDSIRWNITSGVPMWFRVKLNDTPCIRCMASSTRVYNLSEVKPEKDGDINLGYLFGRFTGFKYWGSSYDEISRAFSLLTSRKTTVDLQYKYTLRIL